MVAILVLCLAISTFALSYAKVTVKDNVFLTGTVSLDLNGGKPLITDGEIRFKPGCVEYKDFYVQNTGSDSLYYKFWFSNIDGELAKYIDIKIMRGDNIIAEGKLNELNRSNSVSVDDALSPGELRVLTVVFHMSENAGNRLQNKYVEFVFYAGATQAKNNPDRQF